MKIYNELESLGFFDWLSKTHNLRDTDMKPEYLDELPLNDIHRTVANSMVFRWFREKCNIQGYMCPLTIEGYKNGRIFTNYVYTIKPLYGDIIESEVFETYEEAESACIDKLIEIIKEIK